MLIGVRVDLEVRCLMTGRQSAAAAAEAVESLGRPLKAHRVLVGWGGGGGEEPRLSESFSMFIHQLCLSSSGSPNSSSLIPHPNAEKTC